MMSLKEKKDMEDQFKKVQKPWAKLLTKVNKAKSDYHNACKAEKTGLFTIFLIIFVYIFKIFFKIFFFRQITKKTAINQERNASGDSALSPDQVSQTHVSVSLYYKHPFLTYIFLHSGSIF